LKFTMWYIKQSIAYLNLILKIMINYYYLPFNFLLVDL